MMQTARIVGACALLVAVAAAAEPQAIPFPAPRTRPDGRASGAHLTHYAELRERLSRERRNLAMRWRQAASDNERTRVLSDASALASRGLVDLVNPWIGTPWEFHGTTQVPRQGAIACGYFVTTLLQHLGFGVERVRLAQQPSENIVKTLSPASRTWRFRRGSIPAVLEVVRTQPERWFVVGLDLHVGLLVRLDDGDIRFCHASYLEPVQAVCEPAATAAAMESRYHVVGALFTDDLVRAWLEEKPLPTRR